jgi:hypothetical protein
MPSTSRRWPRPSVTIFLALQALDVITTFLGLQMGAGESSMFVNRMLHLGPLAGLIIAKIFALLLLLAAYAFGRARLVVVLNFWFTGVVTWNFVILFMASRRTGS